jgi:TonB family protein
MRITGNHIGLGLSLSLGIHLSVAIGFYEFEPNSIHVQHKYHPIRLVEFGKSSVINPSLEKQTLKQSKKQELVAKTGQNIDSAKDKSVETPGENMESDAAVEASSVAKGSYEDMILVLLESKKSYPSSAQKMGMEGTGKIFIHIGKNGELKVYKLKISTGYDTLDESIYKMVQLSTPFPPIPSHYSKESVRLLVPVRFSLSKN